MAYERNIDSLNQWRLELVDDPGLIKLFGAFGGFLAENPSAEEVERYRLMFSLNALFGIYEKSYYAAKYEIMGPDEWGRFEDQACVQRANAIEAGLWVRMELLLTAEFANHLASACP